MGWVAVNLTAFPREQNVTESGMMWSWDSEAALCSLVTRRNCSLIKDEDFINTRCIFYEMSATIFLHFNSILRHFSEPRIVC